MSKKRITGKIVSTKMTGTVVVAVEVHKKHPVYGKTLRNTKRFKAHKTMADLKVGDMVVIEESRPISREVRWVVIEKLEEKKGK